MSGLYIGLMSGTSLDGVDGVLAAFDPHTPMRLLGHSHRGFAPPLAEELLALNTSGADEIHRAALAANALVAVYAAVVRDLLLSASVNAAEVSAIGAHGQTIRHQPGAFDGTGYTVQLNNPALLAEHTGIDVVADFRTRDVAAGGQGAPLVPAFHRAVFARPAQTRVVLNLGGIANVTVLGADGSTNGFDCGPANALMDAWAMRHTGRPFDADGAWASAGRVLPELLHSLQAEPFFHRPAPKSTGRDLFSAAWLEARLAESPSAAAAAHQDVQCTLAELTAWCCAEAVGSAAEGPQELIVCGGGALNGHLMRRLAARLPSLVVRRSDDAGLPCQQVEAAAFAWLAWRFIGRLPGNLMSATGARGPRVLGALYPGGR